MSVGQMSSEQIRAAGLQALVRELGTVGAVRFLQQFKLGEGDYTTERHSWLDGLVLESLVDDAPEQGSGPQPD